MSASQIDLCNEALSYCGHDSEIASLTEPSKGAQLCRRHYDRALRNLLAGHDWGFARRTAAMSLRAEAPPARWRYRYALPGDCIEPRAIDDGRRVRGNDEAIPFEPEGQDVLTDQVDALLIYTAEATVTARYPQHFADALAWELAARIAPGLTKDVKRAEYARSRAAFERFTAIAIDANRGQADPEPDSSFVTGRN